MCYRSTVSVLVHRRVWLSESTSLLSSSAGSESSHSKSCDEDAVSAGFTESFMCNIGFTASSASTAISSRVCWCNRFFLSRFGGGCMPGTEMYKDMYWLYTWNGNVQGIILAVIPEQKSIRYCTGCMPGTEKYKVLYWLHGWDRNV